MATIKTANFKEDSRDLYEDLKSKYSNDEDLFNKLLEVTGAEIQEEFTTDKFPGLSGVGSMLIVESEEKEPFMFMVLITS